MVSFLSGNSRLGLAVLALVLAAPAHLFGQQTPRPNDLEIRAFAATFVEIGTIRDEVYAQLVLPENKTVERQAALRSGMKERIAQALKAHGLTQAAYDRLEYLVTTDDEWRAVFERRLVVVRESVRPPPSR